MSATLLSLINKILYCHIQRDYVVKPFTGRETTHLETFGNAKSVQLLPCELGRFSSYLEQPDFTVNSCMRNPSIPSESQGNPMEDPLSLQP